MVNETQRINGPEYLEGKTFFTSSACMSVLADALSWANAHQEKIATSPKEANNIAVLSCQVTDLAILNDLRTIERYQKDFPGKKYFISGCLSKRLDIELPVNVLRLETPRENYQFIHNRKLVNFEKPFWIPDFNENDKEFEQGHLFRNMYPLRIGKGCPNKCTYCTIRITRGEFEQYHASRLEKEFLTFENILLIADNPTESQIKNWHNLAIKNNKGFSIRNVEPSTTVKIQDELFDLAERRLLRVYHSPIQSNSPDVLRDMHRSVSNTLETINISKKLRDKGVYVATNIIIDYKDFDQDFSEIYKSYNYVSWNPLWNSIWDRKNAEERFEKYLGKGAKINPTLIKIREYEAQQRRFAE